MNARDVTHDVKIDSHWWWEIYGGRKTAEVRRDDRDYQIGDWIRFYNSESHYYGRRRITHVLRNVPGLADGFAVLSLEDPRVNQVSRLEDQRQSWERAAIAHLGVATKRKQKIAELTKQLDACNGSVK